MNRRVDRHTLKLFLDHDHKYLCYHHVYDEGDDEDGDVCVELELLTLMALAWLWLEQPQIQPLGLRRISSSEILELGCKHDHRHTCWRWLDRDHRNLYIYVVYGCELKRWQLG